ncbi:hypothetical protein HYALB_00001794 [Hymenoscyphus albidus]|uniref:CENP-V/GFA domain-containing protein n=1 Tax=Hymenoscyphus albidus TaxID=595503 RepID=A0A9N9LMA1_9HELO|nr:hypothetical protein HYALB_00001794 [Hymenoscyphus albidus]
MSYPKKVTGGCLCGGVRFEINFSPDHNWKTGPHTCQCTQCRKNSGSLIYTFHTAHAKELTWLSQSTYQEYNSSPGCYRAFCNNCGSSLGWTDQKKGANTDWELAVGTFDEEFLLGKRDEEGVLRGGYGVALANFGGPHFWVQNEIPGVTGGICKGGTRFWEGSKGPVSGGTE